MDARPPYCPDAATLMAEGQLVDGSDTADIYLWRGWHFAIDLRGPNDRVAWLRPGTSTPSGNHEAGSTAYLEIPFVPGDHVAILCHQQAALLGREGTLLSISDHLHTVELADGTRCEQLWPSHLGFLGRP